MVDALDFGRKAEKAFAFLIREHGFSIADSGPTHLTLESSVVRVHIGFDAGLSFELDLTASLRDDVAGATPEPPYRLTEILGSVGTSDEDRFNTVQVTTESALEHFLDDMARALEEHGRRLLLGDVGAFRAVARYRDEQCRSYRESKELGRAREAAALAWAEKDYREVVRALSSVAALLSKSDRRRLEIAKKRTSSS